MSSGEFVVVGLLGALSLAVKVGPLVLVFVLWKRNARLSERVEALEKRLVDRG